MHYKILLGNEIKQFIPTDNKLYNPETIWLLTSVEPLDSPDSDPVIRELNGSEGIRALETLISIQTQPIQILRRMAGKRPITIGVNPTGPYITFAGTTFFGETLEDAIESFSPVIKTIS